MPREWEGEGREMTELRERTEGHSVPYLLCYLFANIVAQRTPGKIGFYLKSTVPSIATRMT